MNVKYFQTNINTILGTISRLILSHLGFRKYLNGLLFKEVKHSLFGFGKDIKRWQKFDGMGVLFTLTLPIGVVVSMLVSLVAIKSKFYRSTEKLTPVKSNSVYPQSYISP